MFFFSSVLVTSELWCVSFSGCVAGSKVMLNRAREERKAREGRDTRAVFSLTFMTETGNG